MVVYEYWGNYDIDEDGIAEPIVCAWVGNTIIRLQSNPYPDQKPPFIVVPFNAIPFQMHGESLASVIGDNQKVKTAIVRGVIDNMAQSNNGPPRGVEDAPERFERPTKYLYASHAEANLVAFAAREGIRTSDCSVYVTHMPCASCARTLIQAGVSEVIYGPGKTSMPEEEFAAAEQMFKEASVALWENVEFASDE